MRGVHQLGSTATNGYVYLDEIVIGKGNPQARIGFDMKTNNGTRHVIRLAGEGFNLKEQSGGLQEYEDNYIVERIDGLTGTIHFLNELTLHEGDIVGAANEELVRRMQIRETIKTHLERERQLFPRHIKVLSCSSSTMWIATAYTAKRVWRKESLPRCLRRNTREPYKK